jgi:hypothetical protein
MVFIVKDIVIKVSGWTFKGGNGCVHVYIYICMCAFIHVRGVYMANFYYLET